MKSITPLTVVNLRPTIVIDNQGLEAIKHIVSIAPQEAQWFHTVEPVEYRQSPGEIFLYLSTKLYIPKQNTSAAQVDSNSTMMIEFYNELKVDYKDQQVVNDKLSSMTCWCHSHVNMGPSPSHQDDLQFNSFISDSQKQNLSKWQIMLIFNKKDQFYARAYDPDSGLIFEGVDILSQDDYDFDYIDKAAKTKFLKPKPVKSLSRISSKSLLSNSLEDRLFAGITGAHEKETFQASFLNEAENYLDDIYSDFYPDLGSQHLLPVLPRGRTPQEVYYHINCLLGEEEVLWLSFLCKGSQSKVKNVFTEKKIAAYLKAYPSKPKENICHYLQNSRDTLSSLKEKLLDVIEISNCKTVKDVERIFN
jgi:hypothetical protein